jgi:hypothetical protein
MARIPLIVLSRNNYQSSPLQPCRLPSFIRVDCIHSRSCHPPRRRFRLSCHENCQNSVASSSDLPSIVAKQQTARRNEQTDHYGRCRGAGNIVRLLPSHGYRHGETTSVVNPAYRSDYYESIEGPRRPRLRRSDRRTTIWRCFSCRPTCCCPATAMMVIRCG